MRGDKVSSAREARQVLGATLALTGSVQQLGAGKVRLAVNLIDTRTKQTIDTLSLDAELTNLGGVQDAVAIKVAELLRANLPQDAAALLGRSNPTLAAAYEPFVQGRGRLQRYENPVEVDASIERFQRAIEIDKRYALAYAALGEAYWRKYELTKEQRLTQLATEHCLAAAKIDPNLGPVYVTLALIANGRGSYDDAVSHAKKALEINSLDAAAYTELAKAYQHQGEIRRCRIDVPAGNRRPANRLGPA